MQPAAWEGRRGVVLVEGPLYGGTVSCVEFQFGAVSPPLIDGAVLVRF